MNVVTFDDRLLYLARSFAFVREAQTHGQNRGLRVEAIQHWSSGQTGDSWCCEWATMMLDIAFNGGSPIPRLQACEDVHSLAIEKHWMTHTPAVGDLVLSIDPATNRAHHVGILTSSSPLVSIAGNTSADGVSSNGDGVYEHAISLTNKAFVHYPRPQEKL